MRILHCLRAPVGGLFRHVRDLAAAQAERGHAVGIVCDSTTGGEFERSRLAALEEHCQLGVYRLPMSRQIGLSDFFATRRVRALAAAAGADVLHGHGAKGGAYARLAGASLKRRGHSLITLYTPHGGSLHYSPERLSGRLFLSLERRLAR
ncbi:MAG: glycosyltransferase family 1 protein, partial [Alphaproteobacteria bacterium]